MQNSKNVNIDDKLIRDYVRAVVANQEENLIDTGMSPDEEERLMENFDDSLLDLSSAEMVELAERIYSISYDELKDYGDKDILVLYILDIILSERFSEKFLKTHPNIVIDDPREKITYSQSEEDALKDLILSLKNEIREFDYFRIDALIGRVTGEQTHLMDAVWKKYEGTT